MLAQSRALPTMILEQSEKMKPRLQKQLLNAAAAPGRGAQGVPGRAQKLQLLWPRRKVSPCTRQRQSKGPLFQDCRRESWEWKGWWYHFPNKGKGSASCIWAAPRRPLSTASLRLRHVARPNIFPRTTRHALPLEAFSACTCTHEEPHMCTNETWPVAC